MAVDHDGIEFDECASSYVGQWVDLVGDGMEVCGFVLEARGSVRNDPFAGELDVLWVPGRVQVGPHLVQRVYTFPLGEYLCVHRSYGA